MENPLKLCMNCSYLSIFCSVRRECPPDAIPKESKLKEGIMKRNLFIISILLLLVFALKIDMAVSDC